MKMSPVRINNKTTVFQVYTIGVRVSRGGRWGFLDEGVLYDVIINKKVFVVRNCFTYFVVLHSPES